MVARASSCVGESWCHATFKVKYCHEIFDIGEVRLYVYDLLKQISASYNIPIEDIGFGNNHVHFDVDIRIRSKPEIAKIFRGIIGRRVLSKFPEIKKKYFYGSGFWNPAYYLDNIGRNREDIKQYIRKQQYVYSQGDA
jgi:putative transposase